jgi:hypothetical protein
MKMGAEVSDECGSCEDESSTNFLARPGLEKGEKAF